MASPKPLPTSGDMVEAMRWAGDFVTGHVGASDADSKRGRAAANMYWELAGDEALIVEFDAHDALWMLTDMGVFFNSMDYLYRPVSYTPSRTTVDRDGRIRLVMAHRDPGVHNWLATQGFERGNLYRPMLERDPVALDTRLVKHDELLGALPADTAMVSAAERAAAMWERFHGIRRRYVL